MKYKLMQTKCSFTHRLKSIQLEIINVVISYKRLSNYLYTIIYKRTELRKWNINSDIELKK